MDISLRQLLEECLNNSDTISLRTNVYRSYHRSPRKYSLRELLSLIQENCTSELPPKLLELHPRLAPISAIHFDHFNSCVTDLDAPRTPTARTQRQRFGLLGVCLNFLVDQEGTIYAFCGDIEAFGITFNIALFDEDLNKLDEHKITRIRLLDPSRGNLPINLGYFVMDNLGRVIVVEKSTTIVFIRKDARNRLQTVVEWNLGESLKSKIALKYPDISHELVASQVIAQVMPDYFHGYWVLALGDLEDAVPAYLAKISDIGELEDIIVFTDEVVENGLAIDSSGVYVVSDYALYKIARNDTGNLNILWKSYYEREATEKKPGTISEFGSGSSPSLFGIEDDLIAISDNAPSRVNMLIFDRESGTQLLKIPLFKEGKSANENTFLTLGDSIIAQNWYNSPEFDEDMWSLEPGIVRFDILPNRQNYETVWQNTEVGSTATIRLSTKSGLLYLTIQTEEDDKYSMAFLDFHTGNLVNQIELGQGKGFRISYSPSYILPGGKLIQPNRRGFIILQD